MLEQEAAGEIPDEAAAGAIAPDVDMGDDDGAAHGPKFAEALPGLTQELDEAGAPVRQAEKDMLRGLINSLPLHKYAVDGDQADWTAAERQLDTAKGHSVISVRKVRRSAPGDEKEGESTSPPPPPPRPAKRKKHRGGR